MVWCGQCTVKAVSSDLKKKCNHVGGLIAKDALERVCPAPVGAFVDPL